MKDPRSLSRLVASLLYVFAALVSLAAGVTIAAHLPESSAMRVPIALGGFAVHLFFARLAIRSIWPGLDALWRYDGPRLPVIALVTLVLTPAAYAQQTLFNIPSADVLDKGKLYIEEDNLVRPNDPSHGIFTVRGVYGLGANLEAGVNVGGFVTPGRSTPDAIVALKWQPYKANGFSLTAGAHGLVYLRGATDGTPSGHLYAHGAYATSFGMRLTFGGWVASSGYAASGPERGVLAGIEQKLSPALSFQADWFSGESGLGFLTPGLVWTHGPTTIYGAYSIKNGNSEANAALLELGWLF
jgi:hypothetical protein